MVDLMSMFRAGGTNRRKYTLYMLNWNVWKCNWTEARQNREIDMTAKRAKENTRAPNE
jgi:hypothetical protein